MLIQKHILPALLMQPTRFISVNCFGGVSWCYGRNFKGNDTAEKRYEPPRTRILT